MKSEAINTSLEHPEAITISDNHADIQAIGKDKLICFTIGHSSHSIERFIELLLKNEIYCLIDIRSWPYSNYTLQFNKENLEMKLNERTISYFYMGDSLGGKYSDPNLLFPDGKVNYAKVSQTIKFKTGIKELIKKIKSGHKIAIMCSEKDPFDCHRFVLVSYQLIKNGIQVNHILDDGSVVNNEVLEEKLIQKYKKDFNQSTLFGPPPSKKEVLDDAYMARNIDIAANYNKKSGESG